MDEGPTRVQRLRVALTIDTEFGRAGRSSVGGLDGILSCLQEREARATFFVQGRWARNHSRLLERIHTDGHLVGNHSYSHVPFALAPSWYVRRDVLMAERVIADVTGVSPRPWFRCPYGSGDGSPRIRRALDRIGYTHAGWNVDGGDYLPGSSIDDVLGRVISGCEAAKSDTVVVLLHSWPEATAGALPLIVSALEERSASLVGLDEIEGAPATLRSMTVL